MAAPFGNLTLSTIEVNAQGVLANLRNALYQAQKFQEWLVAHSQADFTGAPLSMPSADAAAMFTAIADAAALYDIFTTGLPPGTYPQPASAYVYQNSINAVVGPLQ